MLIELHVVPVKGGTVRNSDTVEPNLFPSETIIRITQSQFALFNNDEFKAYLESVCPSNSVGKCLTILHMSNGEKFYVAEHYHWIKQNFS